MEFKLKRMTYEKDFETRLVEMTEALNRQVLPDSYDEYCLDGVEENFDVNEAFEFLDKLRMEQVAKGIRCLDLNKNACVGRRIVKYKPIGKSESFVDTVMILDED